MIGSIIVKHWLIIPHVQDYRCTKSSLTHERAIEDLGYALYKCKLFFGHKHPDCHTVKVKARTRKTGKGNRYEANRNSRLHYQDEQTGLPDYRKSYIIIMHEII